jgi:hypothetical protein
MNIQASYSSEKGETMSQLKPLEFSKPTAKYESFATFENEEGQQFIIRVRGCNQSIVKQYIQNLHIYLEVLSNESIQLPQKDDVVNENEFESLSIQEETISLEQITVPQPTNDIDIAFKVAKIEKIQQPYLLNFRLGDVFKVPINDNEPPHRIKYPVNIKPTVTVNVTSGEVRFELVRARDGKVLVDKKVSGRFILTPSESASPGDRFYLRVTGLNLENAYEIYGSITIISLADVREHWF